jgi:hypothetical protein
MSKTRFAGCLGLSLAITLAAACRQDVIAPSRRPVVPTYTFSNGAEVKLNDVAELIVDAPPEPRAWDQSDSALVEALGRSDHKAYVAFKRPGSQKFLETQHLAVQEPWNPKRMVNKGVRAAIDVGTIRAGLALVEAKGGTASSYLNSIGVAIVTIDPGQGPELRASPLVDYVEPILAEYELAASTSQSTIPRAGFFTQTTGWGITAVHASTAWSMSTGTGAKLLIIDTGHQQSHEDLDGVPTGNCFMRGCTEGDANYPHGTWVSGVAIARNNSIGLVGVAPGLNSSDVFYYGACNNPTHTCYGDSVAVALNWAASNLGSNAVIIISVVSSTNDLAVSNAIAAAWAAGHVLVAPVGNAINNVTKYPAANSNVLGVSGLNSDLSFAAENTAACDSTWSNYGSFVDISGPFDAYTTQPTNGYVTKCGTSFAAPHVAGAALIARALHPTWTNYEVVGNIISTAQHVGGSAYDQYTGYGMVRADLAAGVWPLSVTASQVSGHPRLTWSGEPLPSIAYHIYRRVFLNGVGGDYELWATTSSTSWTDAMSSSSFFGYNTWPGSGYAVNYYVVAASPDGYETSWSGDATFIPVGVPPT